MAARLRRILLAVALAVAVGTAPSHSGGPGVATPPDRISTEASSDSFLFYRPSFFGARSNRDLRFLLDPTYTSILTGPTVARLDTLGAAVSDSTHRNPWIKEWPDFKIVYDYLTLGSTLYPLNGNTPSHGLVIVGSDTAANLTERNHVDWYLGHPSRLNGGVYPSEFVSPVEDSIYGTVWHRNSLYLAGPPTARFYSDSSKWTAPDSLMNIGFDHELSHAIVGTPSAGFANEMFPAMGEIIGGYKDETAIYDASYTWPLTSYSKAGLCGEPSPTCVRSTGNNQQARTSLAAYVIFNFRGADTTFSYAGMQDDLAHQWIHRPLAGISTGIGSLERLGRALHDSVCVGCSSKPYFFKDGVPLPPEERLALLIHNWRVASYVNNSFVADKQYGFPPHMGFSPGVHLKAWQDADGHATDDLLAIPPVVTLQAPQALRELTLAGSRTFRGNSYPLVLQPYGSEYWVIRSDSISLGATLRDLHIRIVPEGAFATCDFNRPRLVASAVGYTLKDPDAVESPQWKHPNWVETVLEPKWVDLDSLAGPLDLTVPGFGTTNKAAVLVMSLNSLRLSNPDYHAEAIRYRLELRLVTPGTTLTTSTVVSTPNVFGPCWSPDGETLAFIGGSPISQVLRVPAGGGTPVAFAPSPNKQLTLDWSPRGDVIAYTQEAGAAECNLWVKSTGANAVPQQLTSLSGLEEFPCFQPNGRGIAYLHKPTSSSIWQLRWIALDGSGDRLLASIGSVPVTYPRWSPDGQFIYLIGEQGVLYAVPISGGALIPRSSVVAVGSDFDLHHGGGRPVVIFDGALPHQCLPNNARRIVLLDTLSNPRDTSLTFQRRGAFYWTPRYSQDGTRLAYGTDPIANDGIADRDLVVSRLGHPENDPPHFVNVGDVEVPLHVPFAMTLNYTEPDGEPVTFTAAYLPPGSSLVNNVFSWPYPTAGDDEYVVFRVIDPAGQMDSRVVRLQLTSGSGCPTLDVDGRDGWVEENTVLGRSATGNLDWDVYRLWNVPVTRDGRLRLRIRENENEYTTIDQVKLAVVDHAAEVRAIPWKQGAILLGTKEPIYRATTSDGRDVTTDLDGTSAGFSGQPGDTVLVDLIAPDSQVAPAGDLDPSEGEGGGKEIDPIAQRGGDGGALPRTDAAVLDGTGILVQGLGAGGTWTTVRRLYPRERMAQCVVDTLDQGPLRLVFVGPHVLRNWGRIVPIQVANPITLAPRAAMHSKLGDSSPEIAAADGGTVLLSPADTITLEFDAPPPKSDEVREYFLVSRGVYSSERPLAAQPASRQAIPLSFSLDSGRPNPFSGITTLRFGVPSTAQVRLEIVDIQGRRVRRLVDGHFGPGYHDASWDARDDDGRRVRPGIFLCSLTSGSLRETRRIVLLP